MSYVYYSHFGAKESGTGTTTFTWYIGGTKDYGTTANTDTTYALGPDSQSDTWSSKKSMTRKLQNQFGNHSSSENAFEDIQSIISDGIDDLVGQMEPNTQEATDYMSVIDFGGTLETFTTAFETTETQVGVELETTTVTVSETSY
jgi:hypothetical protein